MENIFSTARVKKYLDEYKCRLDNILEVIDKADQSKDEIMSIIKDILSDMIQERDRSVTINNSIVEEMNYIPALDEAIEYVRICFVCKSFDEVSSKIYDASTSLDFYLSNI